MAENLFKDGELLSIEDIKAEVGEERWAEVERLAQMKFRIARQEAGDPRFAGELEEEEEVEDAELDQLSSLLKDQLEADYKAQLEDKE